MASGLEDETEPTFEDRLSEARWMLLCIAGIFVIFALNWPDGWVLLSLGYAAIVILTGFFPRARRRLSRTATRYRATPRSMWPDTQVKLFVDSVPEPGMVLDGDGVVRHINTPMSEAFGSVSLGDPITFKFRELAIIEAIERVQMSGQVATVPYQVKFPTERHFLIHIAPITLPRSVSQNTSGEEQKPDFMFVIMFDQTERFRVDQLRSDFIANVSHELRTPVASLTGFIETLLGPARDDEASRERFLKIMLEQAHRMNRLVDDLLSLSRIEMRSHVRPREVVDLTQVVHHVCDVMAPLAKGVNLEIKTDLPSQPMFVRGDKDELVQVLQNLVENACKYGDAGDHIDIRGGLADAPTGLQHKNTQWYQLVVQDYGKGIAAEHLPRLTERFYRVDADESKKKMGTGLGLAVVKHILTRHEAHLKIDSIPGEGASFTVSLIKTDKNL